MALDRRSLPALSLALALGAIGVTAQPAGAARPSCHGREATIVGTNQDDVLTGTDDGDVIVARGGNDSVHSGRGDDRICMGSSGPHKEQAWGGAGRDLLFGGSGKDALNGGAGSDRLYGGRQKDELDGGDGRFSSEKSNDKDDLVVGGPGNDRVVDYFGDDVVLGGPGDDQVEGGDGNDTQRGGPGDDHILGSNGNDKLSGGPGDDLVDFAEVTTCGSGCTASNTDSVHVDLASGAASGLGSDRLHGFERLFGGDRWDVLKGTAGDELIYPGILRKGSRKDVVAGRGGRDMLSFNSTSTGFCCVAVEVDLRTGRATGQGGGKLRFTGIEDVAGSWDDDVIHGDSGSNLIMGLIGDDQIFGAGGDDFLYGDRRTGKNRLHGKDELDGGAGRDACRGGTKRHCERSSARLLRPEPR